MAPEVRERALLSLSELVSNSVAHRGLSAPDRVTIHVMPIDNGIRVDVVDDGVGIGDVPPPHDRAFGLRLVDSTTDRWGHTDNPTRVWFEVTG